MLQPEVDGITVAARDEIVDETASLETLKQSLQARLGSTDQAVADLQACIDRLNAICDNQSMWLSP